jgi:hypothetical protein
LAKSCDQPILDTYWPIWQYKAGAWPGLITVHRTFDSFAAEQCNFGLSLDAVHRITAAFQRMVVET